MKNRVALALAALAVGSVPDVAVPHAEASTATRRHGGPRGRKTSPPRGQTHDPVMGVRLTVKYPANGSRP